MPTVAHADSGAAQGANGSHRNGGAGGRRLPPAKTAEANLTRMPVYRRNPCDVNDLSL